MHTLDTKPDIGAQGHSPAKKRSWKTSANGNRYLSFHGLKVTVFPSKRGSGFSVSIAQRGEPPIFFNYPTEADARAAAEQKFLELKASGKFTAPVRATMADIIKDALENDDVPLELEHLFTEVDANLEREGEKADLFRFENGHSYWLPHVQGKVLENVNGRCRLLVTKWWLEVREPYD